MSKLFAVSRLMPGAEVKDRVARFILSTSVEDRGGDTVDQSGWRLENYLKNPVVLWGHDYRTPPIGRCLNPHVTGGALVSDIEFATAEQHPFADTIYQLVAAGFINAGSVGFVPVRYEINRETGGLDFKEQELLEYSIVGVPMNPEALAAARSMGLGDGIARAFDAEHVHRAAVANEYRAALLADAAKAARPTTPFARLKARAAMNSSLIR